MAIIDGLSGVREIIMSTVVVIIELDRSKYYCS
jgi:hypothetical protein